ncbi:L-arabinose isomerase 2 [Propionibacterium freudenreichii]|nr:L-arabinose isomerase 2 [Propionibacterium freudenreichii]SCQ69955.1 L-arabinose isomerase 2 [Propionibacterium freudenreichii]
MSHNIIPDLSQLKVLFLVGSQALYGEETLRQVDEQSEAILAQLRASSDIPVTIEPHQLLTDTDGIHQAVLAANADPSVIGVITWMHTFSPAKMWIRGLEALQKPLLHWHTQAGVALPYADLDFDFMNLNQSAHGDREFGYILTRLGIARKSVIGHVSDPRVTREIGWWTRAAAGWNEVNGLKVARFGDNMRYVAVTEGDKTEAKAVFGVAVNTWAVNELADAIERASDAEVARTMAEYDEQFEVVPELRADGARRGALRDAARIEVGLRAVLEAGDFHAFTDTFEDLGSLPQLPGIAVQRLNLDGYGFGAEGDWKTAILVRVAKVMGAGLPGGASLMEDYTYDLTPGDETILGAHMLEVCPLADFAPCAPGDPSPGHRWQVRSGACGVHRRSRPRRGGGPVGHARPLPADGQCGGHRGTRALAAQAAGGAGLLEAPPQLRDLGEVVAGLGCGPPHGDVIAGAGGGLRRFRQDGRHRAGGH